MRGNQTELMLLGKAKGRWGRRRGSKGAKTGQRGGPGRRVVWEMAPRKATLPRKGPLLPRFAQDTPAPTPPTTRPHNSGAKFHI